MILSINLTLSSELLDHLSLVIEAYNNQLEDLPDYYIFTLH